MAERSNYQALLVVVVAITGQKDGIVSEERRVSNAQFPAAKLHDVKPPDERVQTNQG